jgi:hypothetical protein
MPRSLAKVYDSAGDHSTSEVALGLNRENSETRTSGTTFISCREILFQLAFPTNQPAWFHLPAYECAAVRDH